MYQLLNDYSETAHPDILLAIQKAHLQQHKGYGTDAHSQALRQKLRESIGIDDLAIHFALTGTQANLVCIDAMLSPIDGIVACDSGHIVVNEAGAIEALGHKVIVAPSDNGKLTIDALDTVRKKHDFAPHVVRAKAVYISNSTELGTVYHYDELKALSDYCRSHDMYLFLDGARLGTAIASSLNTSNVISNNDNKSNVNSSNANKNNIEDINSNGSNQRTLTLKTIAELTDIFWLGGTKMGALFGEVIFIPNKHIATDFNIYLKRHGGLMAKGYLLAMQFEALLSDNKYLELCNHANNMAKKLSEGLQNKGIELYVPTETNQVFPILTQNQIDNLKTKFEFYEWTQLDNDRSIVRLVTSWATPEEEMDRFLDLLA